MAGSDEAREASTTLPNVTKLGIDDLQPTGKLTGRSINLLSHQRHKLDDGLLGENPFPDLLDHDSSTLGAFR